MTEQPTARFAIGQRFKTRGKAPRECIVVDILRTYNTAGELVRLRYLTQHEFLGQTITAEDAETTIAMGAIA